MVAMLGKIVMTVGIVFDKTTSGYTKDLSYEECACWNNGNPDIFTGKYDYENGNALDTNLYLVELYF